MTLKYLFRSECFVFAGILIAVAVGVAFGIFLGGGLLFIVWPQINRCVNALVSLTTGCRIFNTSLTTAGTLMRFSDHT